MKLIFNKNSITDESGFIEYIKQRMGPEFPGEAVEIVWGEEESFSFTNQLGLDQDKLDALANGYKQDFIIFVQ